MIDHLTLRVKDHGKSKRFYLAALQPLGYALVMEFDLPTHGKFCGLGVGGKPDFWLAQSQAEHAAPTGLHVAFAASTPALVDAFHAAALAAGGKDDGAPGPRPDYHPGYYGAFVIDPEGQHVEACCHRAAK